MPINFLSVWLYYLSFLQVNEHSGLTALKQQERNTIAFVENLISTKDSVNIQYMRVIITLQVNYLRLS